ncbi:MAG: hypothetical protein ACYC8T_03975 [Myxococcaceae bacterium]
MKWWLPIACALIGCTVRTQKVAEVGSVRVQVASLPGVAATNPVGVALVWVGASQAKVTAGAPLPGLMAEVELPLSAPDDPAALGLAPEERIFIGSTEVAVYRPRIVVFEDVDHSGAFEPAFLSGGGTDRVLGADTLESVAWIMDPEGMLRGFRAPDADLYYASTGGLLTAFIRVSVPEGSLLLAQLDSPVPVVATGGADPELYLACHRVVRTTTQQLEEALAHSGTFHVDTPLDPLVVCGTQAGVCVGEDLDALAPPSFELVQAQDVWHVVQCRRASQLESVVVVDSHRECANCTCDWLGELNAYVASSSSLPAWWPCGTKVPYCDAAGSILTVGRECLPAVPSQGCAAGGGAPNLLVMVLGLAWLALARGRRGSRGVL